MSSATPRAVPLCCPYCGETDLRPGGEKDGGWKCRTCDRLFRLAYLGLSGGGDRDSNEEAS